MQENEYNKIEYCNGGGIKENGKPFIGDLNNAVKAVNDIRAYILGYQKGLANWNTMSKPDRDVKQAIIDTLNEVAKLLPEKDEGR